MTNDRLNAPASSTSSASSSLVETRFIPRQYEPNYAYPLLVLFHARGGDEDQLVRAMPAFSWRNYVGSRACRGPEPVIKRDGLAGFGWGREFGLQDRSGAETETHAGQAEIVHRALFQPEPDDIDRLEEAVFTAIRNTRSLLHVHSERIFLVGCGEGAALAYRFGLTFPERFAGRGRRSMAGCPVGLPAAGTDESLPRPADPAGPRRLERQASTPRARREVSALRAGGLRVAFQSYPCTHS